MVKKINIVNEPYIKNKHITEDIMIDVSHVSMRFNLGIEKGFSLKQAFVDLLSKERPKKN